LVSRYSNDKTIKAKALSVVFMPVLVKLRFILFFV
jgi:hypothetical protein